MNKSDIRWKQRFNNFVQAFRTLEEAVELAQQRKLSNLEKQGMIQAFEYTHELAWNVLKDYLEEMGHTGLTGSKDSTRLAFKQGLIQLGEAWMEMIKARNQTSHTYKQETANKITQQIRDTFFGVFQEFSKKFTSLCDNNG